MTISDAEKRIKDAIDRALDAGKTEAACDIADLVDVLEQLNRVRLGLIEFGGPTDAMSGHATPECVRLPEVRHKSINSEFQQ